MRTLELSQHVCPQALGTSWSRQCRSCIGQHGAPVQPASQSLLMCRQGMREQPLPGRQWVNPVRTADCQRLQSSLFSCRQRNYLSERGCLEMICEGALSCWIPL